MRRFTTLVTFATLATVLAGCGAAPMGVNGQLRGQGFQAMGKKAARGLGCDLTGLAHMGTGGGAAEGELQAMGAALPAKVDLRPGQSPIVNQGATNACVGHALADGIGEYLARKQGRPMDLSPGFIWNQTRHVEKSLQQNIGTSPADAFKIADNLGFATEAAFPTISAKMEDGAPDFAKLLTARPSNGVIADAKKVRLFTGWKPVTTVHALKKALADDMPVMLAVGVYENTMQVGADGKWPMPPKGAESLGGHAITAVGYDNAKKVFIIRNSWGTGWGDKGYAYMPYEFVKTEAMYIGFTATK